MSAASRPARRSQPGATRRDFLTTTAAAAAGAFAAPYIVPASALGRDGATAPSERIVMACIGTGGKGRHNMSAFMNFPDVQMVAVCDVDKRNLQAARDLVDKKYENNDCRTTGDFREIVDLDGIDAVCVSTPDHWHALPTIAALKRGRDVYCEKPLANSVAEGRAICDAARPDGERPRIVQCGSHERSTASIRQACELVRSGRIGKVQTVEINLPCSDPHHRNAMEFNQQGLPPEQPVPAELDYDFWLGHTALAPYHERRCHFWWRFILAYGGGEMTDRGAHVIDLAQLGLGKDDTGPVEFEASGSRSGSGLYDAFFDYKFVNTYADGTRLIGSQQGPRGLKFIGDEGTIFIHVHGGRLEATPESLLTIQPESNSVQLGRSPGHHRNFLDCVKSREEPMASAEVGHRTASICHLNNIAMLTGARLKWDPVKEQTDHEQANRLLKPEMRSPWSL